MADYSEEVATAKELISENGKLVTLQILGTESRDPSKPWKGVDYADVAMQYEDVSAVFVPIIGKDLGVIIVDTELLKRSKQVAIVEPVAEGLEDKINRIQDTDGTIWKVIWSQCLRPAGQTIIYYFGIAR